MSQNLTPCRTMPPPKTSSCGTMPPPKVNTKANTTHSTVRPASGTHQFYSHSEPPTCCMHVHQQPSQTCRPGELLSLREVKHSHKGMTSVSRSSSTDGEFCHSFPVTLKKQDISQGIHANPTLSQASNRQIMHPRNKR